MRKRLKADGKSDSPDPSRRRRLALSRRDKEGGERSRRAQESAILGKGKSPKLQLTNNELAQLRIRVIALENLVIAMLAEAPGRQLDLVREMAAYISPRRGFTRHPLTIHAAAQMMHLVQRAGRFRIMAPS